MLGSVSQLGRLMGLALGVRVKGWGLRLRVRIVFGLLYV